MLRWTTRLDSPFTTRKRFIGLIGMSRLFDSIQYCIHSNNPIAPFGVRVVLSGSLVNDQSKSPFSVVVVVVVEPPADPSSVRLNLELKTIRPIEFQQNDPFSICLRG